MPKPTSSVDLNPLNSTVQPGQQGRLYGTVYENVLVRDTEDCPPGKTCWELQSSPLVDVTVQLFFGWSNGKWTPQDEATTGADGTFNFSIENRSLLSATGTAIYKAYFDGKMSIPGSWSNVVQVTLLGL